MSFSLSDVLKDVSNLDTNREQIEYIRRDLIHPDPNNFYALSGLDQLADNIATCGLQQPIRVRPHPDQPGSYMIVSGHRRNAAIEILAKEDPDAWAELPCIVERENISPSLQQLRLIYANANTRTMTSAELAEQAAQVEDLLYKLKEEGCEFPGRMRDHVAEACNASASKLARVRVIRSGLIPTFMRLWEGGKLPDDTADVLAHQKPLWQELIYRAQTKRGNGFNCTAGHVRNVVDQMELLRNKKITCEKTFSSCMHIDCRIANAAGLGPYARMCCKGCCRTCTYLEDCTYSCHEAAGEKKAIKQRKREKSAEEWEEKRAKEAPERNILLSTYNRIRQIRIEKGISQEAFLEASLGYCYGNELEKLDAAELGEKLNLNTRMPGGIWPRDVLKIIATADLLGISIDEMYGHKVPGKAADAPVAPTGDTCTGNAWQTGDPITVT